MRIAKAPLTKPEGQNDKMTKTTYSTFEIDEEEKESHWKGQELRKSAPFILD
jgi:hypothetical protein